MEHRGMGLVVIAVLAAIVIALQVWASIESTRQVERVMAEMQQLESQALGAEKTREELLKTRIENRRETLFWPTLIGIMAPMLTAIVAVVGILISWRDHLETRNKERLDRAATDLAKAFERLASAKPLERALGVASLQHFLEPDKKPYHLRALSALVTVARVETDQDVLRSVRIALNQATTVIDRKLFRAITWQGVNLRGVDLSGLDLSGADISGAQLHDAEFVGTNLSEANLEQTLLNGAKLESANLQQANLTGVDLSGASLKKAQLQNAVFTDVWVHNLDLEQANLQGAQLDVEEIAWDQIRNWRSAEFDAVVVEQLVQRYGPLAHGPRILMLLWEIPPYVEGGSWTACYHLVRKLRQAGADIAVAVPWDDLGENLSPFGVEVEIVKLGIRPPSALEHPDQVNVYGSSRTYGPYSRPGYSPYGSAYYGAYSYGQQYSYNQFAGIYGSRSASIYGGASRGRSSRDFFGTYSLYSASNADNIYPIFGVVQEFARRVVARLGNQKFDVIHAQDWVTFRAAEELSNKTHIPWLAHFHSTEADRQPFSPHPGIRALEQRACDSANKLIAVSRITAERLANEYQTPTDHISVVHNPISQEVIDPLNWGTPETRRVVFLGRFAEQKGVDYFVALANHLKPILPAVSFVMYGDGQRSRELEQAAYDKNVTLLGAIDWEQRYEAFRGASVVVVPSRYEPFGMVILEAMLHRVPVIFPEHAGAAEVIKAGFPLDPSDIDSMSSIVGELLLDWTHWKRVVDEQVSALNQYLSSTPEKILLDQWQLFSSQKNEIQN
jgi:glycosyltransferase involved in cell wall biosynthesis